MFDPDKTADPFVGRHRGYIEAVKAGDLEALAGLFHNDALLMPPNEATLYGGLALKEWHQDYFQNFKIVTLDETEREVKVLGGWAIERWAYTVVIESLHGAESIRDDGRFLKNWTREPDGIWRIAFAMFNSVHPVGSGTSRFLASIRKP